eukprot:COSAG04_NODE_17758_length_459_cov_1.861111_1_plen_104_part_10
MFKKGPKGVGYYLDKKPQPKFQPNLKKQPAKQQQQGQPGGWVKMKGGLKYQDMKPGRCVTLSFQHVFHFLTVELLLCSGNSKVRHLCTDEKSSRAEPQMAPARN